MISHNITKTNQAIRELIERTENPRHRFLLMAYDRHRNLEMAGRYEELFAPDMMVQRPVYHLHANGLRVKLTDQEEIKDLYRVWAETNQSVYYTESESVTVSDHFVTSMVVGYHQMSGRSLIENKILSYLPAVIARFLLNQSFSRKISDNDESSTHSMYLYKNTFFMVWPYDEYGRLLGENIWEPEPANAEITKLAPGDVLTTREAGRLLAPLIKPLPSFEEMLSGSAAGASEHVARTTFRRSALSLRA